MDARRNVIKDQDLIRIKDDLTRLNAIAKQVVLSGKVTNEINNEYKALASKLGDYYKNKAICNKIKVTDPTILQNKEYIDLIVELYVALTTRIPLSQMRQMDMKRLTSLSNRKILILKTPRKKHATSL